MSSVLEELKKAFKYKDAIVSLGIKDLKLKYSGSFLGFFWSVLEPLSVIIIYSLIFPIILKANFKEWVLFFIAGLIPYRFFDRGVTEIMTSIVEQRDLLSKIKMPLEVIPFSKLFSDSISFVLESSIVVAVIIIFVEPSIFILFYPVLFVTELLMILGIGLFLCSYYSKYRDLSYILRVFFEAFFFLTPIVYRISSIPEIYRRIYILNPLARLIYIWQGIILYSSNHFVEYFPIVENTGILFLISIFIFMLGYYKFINSKKKIMEEI